MTNLVFTTELPPSSRDTPVGPTSADAGVKSASTNLAPAHPARLQYDIRNWTTLQGLPANKVSAVLRTQDGYLWVGTVDGLARFDGVRFTVFNDVNTPEFAAIGFNVRALFEDDEGRLWIGTRNGLLCREHGGFVSFPGQDEIRGNQVLCIARRSAGGFWFGANDKLGYWDGRNLRWETTYPTNDGNNIVSLAEGPGEMLWVGRLNLLWGRNLRTRQMVGPFLVDPVRLDDRIGAYGLLVDRSGKLWIGSSKGIWQIEAGATQPHPIWPEQLNESQYPKDFRFTEDGRGNIWATSEFEGGLVRFDRNDGKFIAVRMAEEMGVTLCIAADAEGALWIGTQDRGLFRLRPRVFSTLAAEPDMEPNRVTMVTEAHDGSLWFTGSRYLWHWFGREVCLFDTFHLNRAVPIRPGISALGTLSAKRPCVGYPAGGIFQPPNTPGDPQWLSPVDPRFREVGPVRAIHTRRDGSVWLGTTNGLYQVTGEASLERVESLADANIRMLFEDQRSNFWIATEDGGLIRWNSAGIQQLTREEGLSRGRVNAMHEDERGHVWIATDGGLCVYQENQCLGFGPESNVPQELIYGIVEDDSHRLWLADSEGVSRVARNELEAWLRDHSVRPAVARFDKSDGLLGPGTLSGSGPVALRGNDGRLWFATRGGLAVVNPDDCDTNVPPPQLWIEQVRVDGKTLMRDGLLSAERGELQRNGPANIRSTTAAGGIAGLRLPPGSGEHVEIRYTATSLLSPEKVRIRYQLVGHDSDWRESGSVREAVYANLRPGSYRFRIQARNHEGRWSERDNAFAFTIAPFFWQTRLFYVVSSAALACAIGALLIWRIGRERHRHQAERLQALESERLRIARDMHDHLGAQLAGVALATGENESAHQRARETLRELNDLIWSVHPSNDTLPSLADFISNFASRFLGAAGMELDLQLPDSIPAVPISSRLRHEIAGMFKEALRNITQHARAKRATVQMRIAGTRLILTIRDDGRGFDAERIRDVVDSAARDEVKRPSDGGNGLRNFHARAAKLGGHCRIISSVGSGTEIEFTVPLEGLNLTGT